ncbi:MAG: hypothetical protein HY272_00010 [Gammaproteobacteria bacterium]|nr:hypothetical protein [Gammaproteobacteria bacterium]
MLINKKLLLSVILWLPLQVVAFVPLEQEQAQQRVEQIMDLSGINAMISQAPVLTEDQVRNISVFIVDKDELDGFGELATRIFEPSRLHKAISWSLLRDYDAARYQQILEALNSPIARQMTHLELDASAPAARSKIFEYAQSVRENLPWQRIELIRDLTDASGMVEAMVDVRLGWYESLVRSQNSLLPYEWRISEERLAQVLEELRPRVVRDAREWLLVNSLYAYRNVDDQELLQYVELYEGEAMRWYSKLANRALVDAYKEADAEWAKGVTELLGKPRGTTGGLIK